MIHGECLCGKVKFEIAPPARESAHCHCSYCRRAHGAAFVTWVAVSAAGFSVTEGNSALRWFRSSQQGERGFCTECGSTLFYRSSLRKDELDVTRANLLDDPGVPPRYHCFIDQRVDWVTVSDGLKKLTSDSPELALYRQISPRADS